MKRVIASILLGLLFTGCFSLISVYSQNEALCDKFVRVHIIAHSNSPYDQHMKYIVRDEIFRAYEASFSKLHSKRDRKSTRLNSSHKVQSRMPSSA